jgi:outer membrane protein
MKKMLIAAAVGMWMAGSVAAQESPWLVRVRAVDLNMANEVTTSTLAGLNVAVNDKLIGEVDVSYFFNKNVAAELILTLPQKQVVSYTGGTLGTFKHLPPTLTLQYHFTNFQGFKPYVGAGLNYTKITGDHLASSYHLDTHSYGAAFQAGVDIPLTKQVSLNFDVKKVNIRSKVYSGSTDAGTLKLDPVLVGFGVGYRF